MTDTGRRVVLTVLVGVLGASLFIAGAGHVYLREWRRAAAWFTAGVGTLVVAAFALGDPASIALDSLPLAVSVPFAVVLLASVVDAYRVARRGPRSSGSSGPEGPACPHCGRPVDPSLDFCQWCTEPIDADDLDDATSPSRSAR
jgi:hypothetical protein